MPRNFYANSNVYRCIFITYWRYRNVLPHNERSRRAAIKSYSIVIPHLSKMISNI